MIFSPDVTYMDGDRNGQRQREMERRIFSLSIEKKNSYHTHFHFILLRILLARSPIFTMHVNMNREHANSQNIQTFIYLF